MHRSNAGIGLCGRRLAKMWTKKMCGAFPPLSPRQPPLRREDCAKNVGPTVARGGAEMPQSQFCRLLFRANAVRDSGVRAKHPGDWTDDSAFGRYIREARGGEPHAKTFFPRYRASRLSQPAQTGRHPAQSRTRPGTRPRRGACRHAGAGCQPRGFRKREKDFSPWPPRAP